MANSNKAARDLPMLETPLRLLDDGTYTVFVHLPDGRKHREHVKSHGFEMAGRQLVLWHPSGTYTRYAPDAWKSVEYPPEMAVRLAKAASHA